MSLSIAVVDAFTTEAFRGNPAAVVIGHGADDWMQRVAAEMKHSETAFLRLRTDGGYDLRWFTPESEVDLCGHATLASAHILFSTGRVPADEMIVFHTRGGELRATRQRDGGVMLDFPIAVPLSEEPKPDLFAALGIAPVDFLRTDGEFFMCVVDDAATIRTLDPDFAALRALSDVRGVYVTALDDDDSRYDIVSRCFAPKVGIDEDPVTGSMHCVLLPYWAERLGRDELHAYQASARGGALTVARKGDRALLTGSAVTVLEGELA
jgi:PhzF family phenazine biosynthesis protein